MPPCPNRMGIQRLPSATALIWQISIAARTAVSSGSYSPKTVGLSARIPIPPTDDRNLIIFEALVPNPPDPRRADPDNDGPFAKLAGCRPIVEFWLSLSNTEMTTSARGKALHDFFLNGLPKDSIAKGLPKNDIGPIVNTRHYAGGPASGQIRTNQFMEGSAGH